MIRILTLSNKPHLLPEAVASVKAQTRPVDEHRIVLDDGSRDWGGRFAPNVFWNEQLALCDPDDYVLWLSDDDKLLPNAVADLAGYLDAHPAAMACYGAGWMYIHKPPAPDVRFMHIQADKFYDGSVNLGGRVGAGMVMWKPACWREIGPFPEWGDARTSLSDGDYFTLVAKRFGLHPIGREVVYTRVTPWSAHGVPREGGGGVKPADWRREKGCPR